MDYLKPMLSDDDEQHSLYDSGGALRRACLHAAATVIAVALGCEFKDYMNEQPDAAWRLKWLQSKDGLEIEAWAIGEKGLQNRLNHQADYES